MQILTSSVICANNIRIKSIKKERKMIESFRKKLQDNGQSLKWWHNKYLKEVCRYNYFVVQINNPEYLKKEVKKTISDYLKDK